MRKHVNPGMEIPRENQKLPNVLTFCERGETGKICDWNTGTVVAHFNQIIPRSI